jgi:hypothetical protein
MAQGLPPADASGDQQVLPILGVNANHGCGPGLNTELMQDVFHMLAHRLDRYLKRPSYVRIGFPQSYPLKDLAFPRGEAM